MSTEDTELTENRPKNKLLFESQTYEIRGAVFEVYRELGCGFLESVYQECLEIEFRKRKIPYLAQHRLNLTYKGQVLKQVYIPDFMCFNEIIVEIKAVSTVSGEHRAQIMNYLKATSKKLGLLVNFGSFPKATVDRIVF